MRINIHKGDTVLDTLQEKRLYARIEHLKKFMFADKDLTDVIVQIHFDKEIASLKRHKYTLSMLVKSPHYKKDYMVTVQSFSVPTVISKLHTLMKSELSDAHEKYRNSVSYEPKGTKRGRKPLSSFVPKQDI